MTMTQSERTRKYLDSNPEAKERHKISRYKTNAKKFINAYAKEDDLLLLEELIAIRRQTLEEDKE